MKHAWDVLGGTLLIESRLIDHHYIITIIPVTWSGATLLTVILSYLKLSWIHRTLKDLVTPVTLRLSTVVLALSEPAGQENNSVIADKETPAEYT